VPPPAAQGGGRKRSARALRLAPRAPVRPHDVPLVPRGNRCTCAARPRTPLLLLLLPPPPPRGLDTAGAAPAYA